MQGFSATHPRLVAIHRSLRVALHLVTGATLLVCLTGARRLGLTANWSGDIVRWWHARLCRSLGLTVEVTGGPAPHALLVANHVSWLDIPVIGSQAGIDFLSKAEVRDWPLIGWMAATAGTLFITRGGNQTAGLVPRIGERIRAGGHVAIFPEGTTSDGTRLRRFHPRLFAAGQLAGVAVQPVAVRYGSNAAPDPIAPFLGEEALLPHLLRLVRHPGLRVQIRFLSPLVGHTLTRRQISDHCHAAIAEALYIGASPSPAKNEDAPQPLVPSSLSLVEAARA